MQICLVGYMTAGKSTLGELLAQKMELPFADLDQRIADEAQISVHEYIRTKGELSFRKLEREVLHRELGGENVLALGGGTPCYYDNMDVALEYSFVVYLQWSIRTLVSRIENELSSRPLFDGVNKSDLTEFVAKHVFDRRPYYEKAHHIVFCDGKTEEQICAEILTACKKHQV
ncbi:MAG: shikimate kinase [Bacteroidetes bacterium]|nr:MAG: shikimate kinase [Bacteroidota bacterium]